MIQHVLLWTYRDEVTPEERAHLEAELVALPELVPSLARVEWGPVVGGRNQNFSHCFVMHFDNMDALEEYVTHPGHIRFAGPFKAACEQQVVADFEVQVG